MNGDGGFSSCDGAATDAEGSLLLTSSESSSKRLVKEKELLVFSLWDEVLDMDSGNCSDLDKLLLRLLLCDNELIKPSWSRCSTSSDNDRMSDSSSFEEMLDVMDDDWHEMLSLSMSLSNISLSTNSSDDV